MESSVRITLNGEHRLMPGPLSVAELLRQLGLKAEHVAVESTRASSRDPGTPTRR